MNAAEQHFAAAHAQYLEPPESIELFTCEACGSAFPESELMDVRGHGLLCWDDIELMRGADS